MKSYSILFPLVFLITSCAPAVPAPTVTAIPPTQTNTAIPTATNTPEPTATATPEPTATATLEPTIVPMPDGWMSIAETKEIGGRQVVVNDKGEGATQIDGEWYPVDIKGCYYKEFFDPANQTDPEIDELIQKLNSDPFSYIQLDHDLDISIRHYGSSFVGSLKGGYPRYIENVVDAIIYQQMLCFNNNTNEWGHVIQYIQSYDEKTTPETTKVMRATVGWIQDNKYLSFTYKQQGVKSEKAGSVQEGFQLWNDLIRNRNHIAIRSPQSIIVNNLGHWPEKEYGEAFSNLVVRLTDNAYKFSWMWNDNLSDPLFAKWVLSDNNQMRYWGNKKNWYTYCRNDKKWHIVNEKRCHGEQASEGKFPELVVRVVVIQ